MKKLSSLPIPEPQMSMRQFSTARPYRTTGCKNDDEEALIKMSNASALPGKNQSNVI